MRIFYHYYVDALLYSAFVVKPLITIYLSKSLHRIASQTVL